MYLCTNGIMSWGAQASHRIHGIIPWMSCPWGGLIHNWSYTWSGMISPKGGLILDTGLIHGGGGGLHQKPNGRICNSGKSSDSKQLWGWAPTPRSAPDPHPPPQRDPPSLKLPHGNSEECIMRTGGMHCSFHALNILHWAAGLLDLLLCRKSILH